VSVLLRHFGTAAAVFLLTILSYWKLTLPSPKYIWFDHYDMCQLELPRLQFFAREVNQGRIPLWNPHTWTGQTAIGSSQPGALYPLNLAFLSLPLRQGVVPVTTWNWWFIAIHALAAYFCYLLLRDLELSRTAAMVGAVSFSCSGFLGGIPWLDIANGVTWTPVIFLFLIRILHGKQMLESSALLGTALAASFLSGHHEIPLLNSYAVLLWALGAFLYRAFQHRHPHARLLASIGLAFSLALLLSAIQILPVLEFGTLAKRWVGSAEPIAWSERVPYTVHAAHSLSRQDALGLLIPASTPEMRASAPVGLTIAILAVIGLVKCWTRVPLRCIALLGLISGLFALGSHTPFHRVLYDVLPFLDKARTPVRALALVTFSLSILGAYGAHTLLNKVTSARPLIAIFILVLVFTEVSMNSRRRMTPLNAQSICAADLFGHQDLIHDLRSIPNLGRITMNRDDLMTNLGELYGFDQLQGFVAAAPANLLVHEFHTERTQQVFGVTHHIGRSAAHPSDAVVKTYANGIRLFRKQAANPRAWIVHDTLRVDNAAQLRRTIQDPAVSLRSSALFLGEAPDLERCSESETVTLTRPDTDRVILRAHLKCRGLVVLSDPFYPGWEAFVNGRRAPILEVNGGLRGVVADKGEHVIEMRYRPRSVRFGAALSIVGLALLLGLIVIARRSHADSPRTRSS
jgi:hypothetical protein